MTIKELQLFMHKNLDFLYPKEEIQVFYFMLLEFYANRSRTAVLLDSEQTLAVSVEEKIAMAIEQLKTGKPIQYILGETWFYSNRFFVDENVLIPRQETEELVDWILSETDKNLKISILDIGCGSGCISVSLAKELSQAEVTALDISEKALATAEKNARENGVKNLRFLQQDILKTDFLSQKYDIIVSNPPYVRELEKQEIHNNVLDYEPHLALFVPNDKPLMFYEKIADLAKKSLTENGKLFFEINEYLGKEMMQMMKNKGFGRVELREDLSGNPRMLKAEL
ncbi:peptide chain release factor N(5)-glutamine methyltransferase [Capnocytophaga sp.]|uniref:peptide chain release factor N(5)-glutamine methyltransferase n=1 Tax=Capnocytophaga sp. TaxID=44737 RepID=UPI0026DB0A01|nr:peptide chain release factor N(5)-glutamine methyltransferase [Capnocytophaga sp.]MDO5105951.1 peptide chain release factor N(5)-glutamine methyltransferase [Capnocytophaga sp.]